VAGYREADSIITSAYRFPLPGDKKISGHAVLEAK